MADDKLKRAMRKIEACLALSKSSNEHEAATALRQAKMLMDKFQIEEDDLTLSKIKMVTYEKKLKTTKSVPLWQAILEETVANAFNCTRYTLGNQLLLVGEALNAEIAKYALDCLLRQIGFAHKSYIAKMKREQVERGLRQLSRSQIIMLGKGFREGWAAGCAQKVWEFAQPITDNTREQHHKAVVKEFGSVNKAPETNKPISFASDKSSFAKHAVQFGLAEGKNATLYSGVQGASYSGGRFLTNN